MEVQRRRMIERIRMERRMKLEKEADYDTKLTLMVLGLCTALTIGIITTVVHVMAEPCHLEGEICSPMSGVPYSPLECRVRIRCLKKVFFSNVSCFSGSCHLHYDNLVYRANSEFTEPNFGLGIGILLTILSLLGLIGLIILEDVSFEYLYANLFGIRPRGIFIAFEGIDGCGKTTQADSLVVNLKNRGVKAKKVAFPNRTTETGKAIDAWLSGENKMLTPENINSLFEKNMREQTEAIETDLRNGIWVIAERYYPSFIAYARARGTPENEAKAHTEGMIEPDVVFSLVIEPSIAIERMRTDRETLETSESVENLTEVSRYFADLQRENWCLIDATDLARDIHAIIADYMPVVASLRYSPLLYVSHLAQQDEPVDESNDDN